MGVLYDYFRAPNDGEVIDLMSKTSGHTPLRHVDQHAPLGTEPVALVDSYCWMSL